MRALTLTLLSVLLPLVAAALCLGAYLNYASVRASYLDLVLDRLETVARRVAGDAHMALSVGLPLPGQTALARTLAREMASDQIILAVDVSGPSGTILHSSDPARVGGTANQLGADGLICEAIIATAFGTVAGGVVTSAVPQHVDAVLSALARDIVTAAAVAIVLGWAAIALVIWASVSAMARRLKAQATTRGGQVVPAETAPTFEAIDAAHKAIAARLEGSDGAP